jgi:mannosyltransferase OCH1-like enzyme
MTLYQTWETKDLPPKMNELRNYIVSNNPGFEFQLFDDADRINFIKKHFDSSVIESYLKLKPGAYKADLWRYCVLYIHGGIYLDVKMRPVNGFRFIDIVDKEYYVRDYEGSGSGVWNGMMVCFPGSVICKSAIEQIVLNVQNNYYGETGLYPTGPMLLKQFISQEEINNLPFYLKVKQGGYDINDENGKTILTTDDEVYEEQRQYSNKSSHFEMWVNKDIYNI